MARGDVGVKSPPVQPRMPGEPNLFTIRAGTPFLDTLADAIIDDALGLGLDADDSLALSRLTIFLPTRRAARALSSVLVRRSGLDALVLPRIVPLGDPGEAELHEIVAGSPAACAAPSRAPIDPMARQFLLALQVRQASRALERMQAEAGGPRPTLAGRTLGAAFRLAGDLGGILDAIQAQDIPYDRLKGLDAARFDEHWQATGQLLAILGEVWPQLLESRGEVDPIAWRNLLLDGERERLTGGAARDPVIVAGSTGSMPATARLIAAIAHAPHGAVVLPDLDLDAPPELWKGLQEETRGIRDRAASHPQAQLSRLMVAIGAAPDQVVELGGGAPAQLARRRLAHEALRPAETTEEWLTLSSRLSQEDNALALTGLRVAEAADEREEGLVCAIAIREAIEETQGSVALITHDRGLAERVRLELARWGIEVDDSAGRPLARTRAGRLASVVIELCAAGVTPQRVLSLLGHPAVRLGRAPEEIARLRQAIEIGALRGVRLKPGLQGVEEAIAAMPRRLKEQRAPLPRRRLTEETCADALALARDLRAALAPWLDLEPDSILAVRAIALRRVLGDLTREADGEELAFREPEGEALAGLLDALAGACVGVAVTPDDVAQIMRDEMQARSVRARVAAHPRITLLGPLEARLMSADRIILGGLNEGAWPPQTTTDAFLNRGMRAEIGLPSPERRIGQSAHDFIEQLAAPEVLLTRAVKTAGVQTIPSRFWQRLQTVALPERWAQAVDQGHRLVAWARQLDRPAGPAPFRRPAPRPPAALQPTRYSVTEAETLYRDPYAVFARRILRLDPLEPLDMVLGAADRGTLLHAVLERFAAAWPLKLPVDVEGELLAIGSRVFEELRAEPDVESFWWPRFLAMIPEIAAWERARRDGLSRLGVELRIGHDLALPDGATVRLDARADRVEMTTEGKLVILDFKTGAVPSRKQIDAGLAPQLLLEAALAARAPFIPADGGPPLGPAPALAAAYVEVKPGQPLTARPAAKPEQLAERAEQHLEGFREMVAGFRAGVRPFISRFAPEFIRHEGDYDHLARVKEWTVLGDDAEGDGR